MGIRADTAAKLGRRHQSEVGVDAWWVLVDAKAYWDPIMVLLHKFLVAVSRVTVHHDGRGGNALDPMVWDCGGVVKRCRIDVRVNVDLASQSSWSFLLGAVDLV